MADTRRADRIQVWQNDLGNWQVAVYDGENMIASGGAADWRDALTVTAGVAVSPTYTVQVSNPVEPAEVARQLQWMLRMAT